MKRLTLVWIILLGTLFVGACGDSRMHSQAVYMLVDTSGTYAQEMNKAAKIINYLLATLNSGDSLAVAKVETRSFTEKDIVAKVTFDKRPSQATQTKARVQVQDRGVRQGDQRQRLYRHHRRLDPGRGIPERDQGRHQDHRHLLRHAGRAGQGHAARLSDQARWHPHRRA